ncbi:OmpA family protein [Myxococcus stipitatus]|uniref:OmpA family protein n=1 Tax=Myxococcus stipitatus TaxID=83455 RepID=UPI001F405C47|nr:OmpA family protein [Myxococcus stipitatus]MCE9669769.1 OmpA family protein [Myxococcus stipitatus]
MRTRVPSWALAALLSTALAPQAFAQSTQGAVVPIDLERLRFSPAATDSMLVDTGRLLHEGGYRLMLLANYERGILLLEGTDGVEHAIVDYRVTGWLAGAWSPIANLELSARLPVIIAQGGDSADGLANVQAPKSFGLGTPEVGARFALLDREAGAPVSLALGLDVGLPGGTRNAYGRQVGWSGFQLVPRVSIGADVGPVTVGANFGARIRDNQPEPGRDVGTELEQGVVVATRGKGLRAEVGLQAAESLVESDVALELVGGVRLPVGKGFEAFAIAGHGFTEIPGTPSLRLGAGVAWAPESTREDACASGQQRDPAKCPDNDDDGDTVPNGKDRCPREAGPPENGGCPDTDSDGDGVVDREDACPNEAGDAAHKGCPVRDSDGDGVPDDQDECPNEAGDAAHKGCPVRDSDGDGVPDDQDACPKEAGDAAHKGCPVGDADGDGVPDDQDACPNEAGEAAHKGCPVRDSDGDGVPDDQDACPNEAGDAAHKGCPARDSDGDGVPDDQDACPKQAGDADHKGCPAPKEPTPEPSPRPTEAVVPTSHHVRFPVGQSTLEDAEKRQLDAIAAYLKKHPDISLSIEGHTDNTGPEELNQTLSQQRADMVRQYLVQQGIAGSRLTATGHGPSRPVETNDTPEGRAANRRVEFVEQRGSTR